MEERDELQEDVVSSPVGESMTEPAPNAEGAPPKKNKVLSFFVDILRGFAIGIAFIIPGFSGGSVAAILGIYERIVSAIADIFKQFKKSFLTLLPIVLGMALGIAALIWPIQWGIEHYPIPTVTLFVGFAIGGFPSITDKMRGGKVSWTHILACIIPLIVAAALSFLPIAGEKDLFSLAWWDWPLLVVIGVVGSCALVIPGISGSMLLLIFGYYNPVVNLLLNNLLKGQNVGISLGVLACLGVGVVVGFFAISVLMKFFLKRYSRATHFAIFGFLVGSIPAIYMSVGKEANLTLATLPTSPWYWVVSVLFLIIGFAITFSFVLFAKRKEKKKLNVEIKKTS